MDKAASRKINNLFSRGTLGQVDFSSTPTAQVELLAGEVQSAIDFSQQFGFACIPPKGAEVLASFLNGSRDNGTILRTTHKESVPTDLQAGEAMLHGENASSFFKVLADGSVKIQAGNYYVRLTASGRLDFHIGSFYINGIGGDVP